MQLKMLLLQFLDHQHLPPLTLISSCSTKSVISYFSIAVIAAICFSSFAHAKISTSSYVKLKPCVETRDCRDTNKECVNGKCQCKSNFDYIPEHDECLKPYGATCITFESSEAANHLCNVYKFLACDATGTCSCHLEEGSPLVYDQYLETCVAPPGHQCEMVGFMGVQKGCVQNAKCVHDPNRLEDSQFYGVCKCSKGFLPKGESCLPELGASCELDGDCEQDGMRCSRDRKCECVDDRVYFRSEHECKLKVGEACEVARRDCVSHANCQGERDERSKWKYRCECKLGYHENKSNGTCEKDWHEVCGDDERIYDEVRGRCSLQVGMTCLSSGPNLCVMHAFCGTGNKCQCFEGYGEAGNGTCGKVKNEKPKRSEHSLTPTPSTDDPENIIVSSPKPGDFQNDGHKEPGSSASTSNASSSAVFSIAIISSFVLLLVIVSTICYVKNYKPLSFRRQSANRNLFSQKYSHHSLNTSSSTA